VATQPTPQEQTQRQTRSTAQRRCFPATSGGEETELGGMVRGSVGCGGMGGLGGSRMEAELHARTHTQRTSMLNAAREQHPPGIQWLDMTLDVTGRQGQDSLSLYKRTSSSDKGGVSKHREECVERQASRGRPTRRRSKKKRIGGGDELTSRRMEDAGAYSTVRAGHGGWMESGRGYGGSLMGTD